MEKDPTEVGVKFNRPNVKVDLPEIIKKGKLTVLIENSSTSYFIYKGKTMGFEYEILQQFAESIGVPLEVKVVHNLDSLVPMLNRGEGDIIACNYTVTRERNKVINFSEPLMKSPQVLVQRKPDGWEKMKEEEWKSMLITDPSELAKKEVSVWKNSSYYQRLKHLEDEIGDTIYIDGVQGNVGGEELIEMVAAGIIDYTIAEKNVAKVNQQFFDNLDVEVDLSIEQKLAFGLRKTSPLLKTQLDTWLTHFKTKATYRYIARKYFEMRHVTSKQRRDFSNLDGRSISPYDDMFRKAGEASGWDWRLIAAVAYQESKFNSEARSFAGAYGMMQFMPNTGPHYGVYPDSPPGVQIMGGAKKLMADEKFWHRVPDPYERKKFVLASYNAGRGHVLDAVRLAEKHGKNPLIWDGNVEDMLLNLSKQEYYRDDVVKNGRLRGTTTYHYVHSILNRYKEWSNLYE